MQLKKIILFFGRAAAECERERLPAGGGLFLKKMDVFALERERNALRFFEEEKRILLLFRTEGGNDRRGGEGKKRKEKEIFFK